MKETMGDANGDTISASVNYGNIETITVVPVPGTIWMIGSALLGILGSARRKKA